MSEIFTVSDEAYGLFIIHNEFHRWKELHRPLEEGETEAQRKAKVPKKRYIDPRTGRKGVTSSWDPVGLVVFGKLCLQVKKLRESENPGSEFEKKLLAHYNNEGGSSEGDAYDVGAEDEVSFVYEDEALKAFLVSEV